MRLKNHVQRRRDGAGPSYLFDATTGSLYGLNETAEAVLDALSGGATESETVAAVASRFDVEPAEAERDVALFLGTLREHGLVA